MDVKAKVAERRVGAGDWQARGVLHRLKGNTFLRHNVLLFAANMATAAFSYLFHPVVGHLLGQQGYGSVAALVALSAVLLIPTQIVVTIANKFAADLIAQDRVDQVNYLLRRATKYGLILGIVIAAIFAGLSPIFKSFFSLPSVQPVIFISLGFIISFVTPLNVGVVQGRQQFEWFALLNFLTAFLRVATTYVLLLVGFGINGALGAGLLSGILIYLVSFMPIRDVFRAPQTRISSLRPLLTYSLGTALALGGGTLLVNIDTILVKHFLPSDAGYYAAVAKMGQTVLFVGGSLVWVMFPKVAALRQQGRPYRGILGWTMVGVFVLSASVLVAFWFFAPQAVALILPGTPAAVAHEVVWYGLAMLFLALANVLVYYFLSLGWIAFVPVLLACCALQVALIVAWHHSIAQVVGVMVIVTGILLVGLAVLYVVQNAGRSAYPTPAAQR